MRQLSQKKMFPKHTYVSLTEINLTYFQPKLTTKKMNMI